MESENMNIVYYCFFEESRFYMMNQAVEKGGSRADLNDTTRYLMQFTGFSDLKTAIRSESNIKVLSEIREAAAFFCDRIDIGTSCLQRAARSAAVLLREIDYRLSELGSFDAASTDASPRLQVIDGGRA
jgi:hypothetical protein